MKKTTIIFDCFGVICAESIRPWMLANLGTWEHIKEYFHTIVRRFDLDEIDEHDLVNEFATKVPKTAQVIQEEIDGHLRVDTELVAYMQLLKKKGYKIGLLSNAHHTSFERKIFCAHPELESVFDQVIISSKVGMVKPDPEIYHHALSVLASKADECVFIDDNPANIAGSENVGITGVLYTSLEKLKTDLAALLVTV